MDAFDWRRDSAETMLTFACRWAPYGGGEIAEIWLHFGVSERVFFLRLAHLLSTAQAGGIDDLTRTRLRQLCDLRLNRLEPGDSPPATPTAPATAYQ